MNTKPSAAAPQCTPEAPSDTAAREHARWAALQIELLKDIQSQRALAKSEASTQRAARVLTGSTTLTPVEQLDVYRQQFWLRHTSSLLEDFPGLSGILGQAAWEPLVESYLLCHPPDSWTLRDLGKHLPGHVQTCSWLEPHALCLDMARLEWAYSEVFDAQNSPAPNPAKLSAIAPDAWLGARLILAPCLRLLHVSYPVARLRVQLQRAARSTEHSPSPRIPAPQAQNLVLYRDAAGSLCYSVVDDVAFELLTAVRDGLGLLAACERAADRVPGAAPRIESEIASWFASWCNKGWIVDVEIEPECTS